MYGGIWSGIEFDLAVKSAGSGSKGHSTLEHSWNVIFSKPLEYHGTNHKPKIDTYDYNYGPCSVILILVGIRLPWPWGSDPGGTDVALGSPHRPEPSPSTILDILLKSSKDTFRGGNINCFGIPTCSHTHLPATTPTILNPWGSQGTLDCSQSLFYFMPQEEVNITAKLGDPQTSPLHAGPPTYLHRPILPLD